MISFILVKKVTIEHHDDDEGHVFKFVCRPLSISTSNEWKAFFLQKIVFYELLATFMNLGLHILAKIKKVKRFKDLQTKFEDILLAL